MIALDNCLWRVVLGQLLGQFGSRQLVRKQFDLVRPYQVHQNNIPTSNCLALLGSQSEFHSSLRPRRRITLVTQN
jgi:hypothetical protein